jgi:hypothetical protein
MKFSSTSLTSSHAAKGVERSHADLVLPRFSHALMALGGANGLAAIMEGDEGSFSGKSPEDFFSLFLNVCPRQGGASIRSEDALLLALGYLRPALLEYGGNV